MRFTSFILAVLVLALSCLPCADTDATPDYSIEVMKHGGPGHPHEHKDLCSPFCHCACCSTYSVIKILIGIPTLAELPAGTAYASGVPGTVIEISLPIWQPPQLV